MAPHRLTCALCDWSIAAWRTLKSGERRHGYRALRAHYELCHPRAWERLEALLRPYDDVDAPDDAEEDV